MAEHSITAPAFPLFDYQSWLERDLVPDFAIRLAIRHLVRSRLRELEAGGPAAQSFRQQHFFEQLAASPVALHTDSANAQHYEVPAEFFELVLGPQLKYSCALFDDGASDLASAEEAMLDLTCRRARLEDGHDILELGCGWGSLSLYMAGRYPNSRILAVSNSHSQREFITRRAAYRRLGNLEVVTADMNHFATTRTFNRVVSVEMFEHMRNYGELLRRIDSWLRPDGLLFVHIFSHVRFAYPFEVRGPGDWMAQHFFSGGIMPSDGLLSRFDSHLVETCRWRHSGLEYQRTCEDWLRRLDNNRDAVLAIFRRVYGDADALRFLVRWRVFFMACAELFGFRGGSEWGVSHHQFSRPAASS